MIAPSVLCSMLYIIVGFMVATAMWAFYNDEISMAIAFDADISEEDLPVFRVFVTVLVICCWPMIVYEFLDRGGLH